LPVRFFSTACFKCLANVDLPMPGRPTGTKNSFFTEFIYFYEIRSTTNFNSVASIFASSQLNGTETSYKKSLF